MNTVCQDQGRMVTGGLPLLIHDPRLARGGAGVARLHWSLSIRLSEAASSSAGSVLQLILHKDSLGFLLTDPQPRVVLQLNYPWSRLRLQKRFSSSLPREKTQIANEYPEGRWSS